MKPNNNESTDGSTVGGDVLSHGLQSPVAVLVPQTTSTTRRAVGSRMIPRTLQYSISMKCLTGTSIMLGLISPTKAINWARTDSTIYRDRSKFHKNSIWNKLTLPLLVRTTR